MYGRTLVLAVAACGWMVASLLAFVLVSSFSFFGIGLIGLLLWFVCVRMDLEKDAAIGSGWTPGLIQTQYEARQKMSDEQRAAYRHQQALGAQVAALLQASGHGAGPDRRGRLRLVPSLGFAEDGFAWFVRNPDKRPRYAQLSLVDR